MASYAQTNVQLYAQLLDAGYSNSDLKDVRNGYELEAQLVTAKFRANGKPEITHLIGTASILAAHRMQLSVVLAGLLHNAYITGDFGSFWPRRMTRCKRRIVREVIGVDAEKLVARYSLARWDTQKTASWAKKLPLLSEEERAVLIVRLANELEEAADLFCDHDQRRQQKLDQLVDYIAIAKNMGLPHFAAELQDAHRLVRSRQFPVELVSNHLSTYHSPPLSYQRRPKVAVSYMLRLIWRHVPETIRSRFRSWFVNRAINMD